MGRRRKPQGPTLFDTAAAVTARDEAIYATLSANEQWCVVARGITLRIAALGKPFTAEAIWKCGLSAPKEPRAMGAVFMALRKEGRIKPTGRYVPSSMVSNHGRPMAEWIGTAS